MGKTGYCQIIVLIFFLSLLGLVSCQDNEPKRINNNEIKASIIKGVGDTVKLVTTGDQTFAGCSLLGSEMEGTTEYFASISLSILVSPTGCVDQPGTYNFLCKYYKDKSNGRSAVFSNYEDGGIQKGSITFNSAENEYWEGSFRAVCQCEFLTNCIYGKDSVVIVGTFKVDYF